VNFFVTVLTQRAPGLGLTKVRPFTWSTFVTSSVLLISTPVFLAGLLLTYLDLHFGGALYSFAGADRVWIHTVWLFGRPEAFLLMLPALGAASDIVINRIGRPLVGGPAAHILLALFGALSLGVWAADTYIASAVVLPTARWLTALVAIPVALLVLLWLGSLRFGLKPDVGLLYVAGFVLLLALGAANVIIAAFEEVDVASAWRVGHVHLVVFGAPLFVALGALAEWSPLAYGRRLVMALNGLAGLALLGGIAAMTIAEYLLGYDGAPAYVSSYDSNEWRGLNILAEAGGGLVTAGAVLFVLTLVVSVALGKGAIADDHGPADLALAPATGGAA
jgi:heme/copper-type cytochrome/quinol oxidase subunit 1